MDHHFTAEPVHSGTDVAGAAGVIERGAISRSAALWQMAVGFALLEAALWTSGRAQIVLGCFMLGWVAFCLAWSGLSGRELGLSREGFRQSLWVIPAGLAVAGLMAYVAALGGVLHDLHGARTPLLHSAGYAIWALVQEIMAQSFYFLRMESVFQDRDSFEIGSKRAVLATALLFSVAHIPNPVLLAASLVMGLVLSELFRRYRNVYPLAIAHAILGLAVAISLPEAVTHGMRVGIAFWR